MINQTDIDIRAAASDFERARRRYKGALSELGLQLDGEDWPAWILFFESGLEPGRTIVVPPALLDSLHPDCIAEVALPWLRKILQAEIVGLAAPATCFQLDIELADGPESAEVVVLQVVGQGQHECWMATLEGLTSGEGECWSEVDPRLGILAAELHRNLNPQA